MIRVLLWDEDSFVLAGMQVILAEQPDIEVVGDARTADDVWRLVELHQPNVLVMDALLPDADVFDVIRKMQAKPTPPSILILTTFNQAAMVCRFDLLRKL